MDRKYYRARLPNNQTCKHIWGYLGEHYKNIFVFYCIKCRMFSFKVGDAEFDLKVMWKQLKRQDFNNQEFMKGGVK